MAVTMHYYEISNIIVREGIDIMNSARMHNMFLEIVVILKLLMMIYSN